MHPAVIMGALLGGATLLRKKKSPEDDAVSGEKQTITAEKAFKHSDSPRELRTLAKKARHNSRIARKLKERADRVERARAIFKLEKTASAQKRAEVLQALGLELRTQYIVRGCFRIDETLVFALQHELGISEQGYGKATAEALRVYYPDAPPACPPDEPQHVEEWLSETKRTYNGALEDLESKV